MVVHQSVMSSSGAFCRNSQRTKGHGLCQSHRAWTAAGPAYSGQILSLTIPLVTDHNAIVGPVDREKAGLEIEFLCKANWEDFGRAINMAARPCQHPPPPTSMTRMKRTAKCCRTPPRNTSREVSDGTMFPAGTRCV